MTILGSTGSIGVNTLDLIARNQADYNFVALTAHKNVDGLVKQAREFKPEMAVIADPGLYDELKAGLAGTNIQAMAGPEALVESAQAKADWVMAGIVGAAGLKPTLEAIRQGATVGLANKECLVSAGDIMTEFDGNEITGLNDYAYALRQKQPGDVVEVVVTRGDENVSASVTLSARR